jgi:hypothetical protein
MRIEWVSERDKRCLGIIVIRTAGSFESHRRVSHEMGPEHSIPEKRQYLYCVRYSTGFGGPIP